MLTLNEHILDLFSRLDVEIVGGEGNLLVDSNGKKYLDFITGVGVNQLGYSNNLLLEAVNKTNNVIHLPLHYRNKFSSELASILTANSRLSDGKVFFCTSGSEANEAFIKFLQKSTDSNRENIVVTFSKSFHGRTLGSLNLTRQTSVRKDFISNNGFKIVELPFNDIQSFESFCSSNKPAAIIVEPVQGSGGIQIANEDFLYSINNYCAKNNVFFAIDEVQSGMGRTGTLFASSKYNLTYDFIMFGKGTGGGLPLAGVILNQKVANNINLGDHGTTWCNPFLSAALGLETINYIFKKNILNNVSNRSQQFEEGLCELKSIYPSLIKDVRISGLMVGIELFLDNNESKVLQNYLMHNNLLVDITQGNTIRMLPALTLTSSEVVASLLILSKGLESIFLKTA